MMAIFIKFTKWPYAFTFKMQIIKAIFETWFFLIKPKKNKVPGKNIIGFKSIQPTAVQELNESFGQRSLMETACKNL